MKKILILTIVAIMLITLSLAGCTQTGSSYKITTKDDGEFTVTADCNTGNGTYIKNDSSLVLDLGIITSAARGQ